MKTLNPITLCTVFIFAFFSINCHKSDSGHLALSPGTGPDSTLVSIEGGGFSKTIADDSVFFNGKQATVISASSNRLVAMVPTLAGTGDVTVTVGGKTSDAGVFTYDTTYRLGVFADNLAFPQYLTIDTSGNLYVPTGNSAINKITPQGAISTLLSISDIQGITIDAKGNLYVSAEPKGDSFYIYKVTPTGQRSLYAKETGPTFGLAMDGNGNLYVTKPNDNAIDKITPQGVVGVYATGLYIVSGVAVGNDGTVYTINYSSPGYNGANGIVSKITPDGTVSTVAKGIWYAGESDLTIDENNNLYVLVFDQGTILGSVVKITPGGTITTLASGGFFLPTGIVRDRSGNLYVTNVQTSASSNVGNVVKLTMH